MTSTPRPFFAGVSACASATRLAASALDSWLWVKNVWMPDSPFAAAWPNLDSLRQIATNEWLAVFNKLPQETLALLADKGLALTVESFTGDALNTTIQTIYTTMEQLPAYMEHVKYYSDLAIPLFNIHKNPRHHAVHGPQWTSEHVEPLYRAELARLTAAKYSVPPPYAS